MVAIFNAVKRGYSGVLGLSVVWHDFQIMGNRKGCPYGINASFRIGTSLNSDNRMTLIQACWGFAVASCAML